MVKKLVNEISILINKMVPIPTGKSLIIKRDTILSLIDIDYALALNDKRLVSLTKGSDDPLEIRQRLNQLKPNFVEN